MADETTNGMEPDIELSDDASPFWASTAQSFNALPGEQKIALVDEAKEMLAHLAKAKDEEAALSTAVLFLANRDRLATVANVLRLLDDIGVPDEAAEALAAAMHLRTKKVGA